MFLEGEQNLTRMAGYNLSGMETYKFEPFVIVAFVSSVLWGKGYEDTTPLVDGDVVTLVDFPADADTAAAIVERATGFSCVPCETPEGQYHGVSVKMCEIEHILMAVAMKTYRCTMELYKEPRFVFVPSVAATLVDYGCEKFEAAMIAEIVYRIHNK